jgi:hypothetical protein
VIDPTAARRSGGAGVTLGWPQGRRHETIPMMMFEA